MTSASLSQPRAPSPLGWSWATACGGVAMGGLDALLAPSGVSVSLFVAGLGLGLMTGLIGGAGLAAMFWALARAPRWVPLVVLPLLGAAGGFVLATELGAFARLHSPYRNLALALLVAAGFGGVALGAIAAALRERSFEPGGLLFERRARRAGLAVLLLVGAAVVTFGDRRYLEGLYPLAHDALRGIAIGLTAGALRCALPGLPRRLWRAAPPLALALAATSFLLFASDPEGALHARVIEQHSLSFMLRSLRALSDIDRDGYSSLLGGGDCAGFDADVHPAHAELPGNQIDDNCLAGDAPAPIPPPRCEELPMATSPSPLNVVLITIDTMRFDRLSLYGHARDTTPRLLEWSKRALRFDRAYTAGGLTSISLPSLFRGLYPRSMLWTQLVDTHKFQLLRLSEAEHLEKDRPRFRFALPLDDASCPLPQRLARRGMRTAAVVDDGAIAEILDRRYMGDGFESYEEIDALEPPLRNDDAGTTERAIARLRELSSGDRPYFLWVHYFGLHGPVPYRPSIPFYSSDPRDEYDHALAYLDSQLGLLLDALEAEAADTAVLMTSDHGEAFGVVGRSHGKDMHETSIRVPLLMRVPGGRTGSEMTAVNLVDVLPTVLNLTATPSAGRLDGVDLVPLATRGVPLERRILLSDSWGVRLTGDIGRDLLAGFDGERKLVFDRRANVRWLFQQSDLGPVPKPQPPAGAHDLWASMIDYLERTGSGPLFAER